MLPISLADAKGSAVPSTSAVTTLESLICSDQRAAAKQILSAVEAGGSQAQVGKHKGQPCTSLCSHTQAVLQKASIWY